MGSSCGCWPTRRPRRPSRDFAIGELSRTPLAACTMPSHPKPTAFTGKRVLITGGLGFIGSNLARTLVRQGAEVTIIDSLIPEYGGNLRNLAGIEAKVRVNISDVRDHHSLPGCVRVQYFLFNLAGQTSHMDSMADPQTDLEINARAQRAILEACRAHNPAIRIVF